MAGYATLSFPCQDAWRPGMVIRTWIGDYASANEEGQHAPKAVMKPVGHRWKSLCAKLRGASKQQGSIGGNKVQGD
eukprot:scaffold12249_cov17-Tisochrysis_lutea.AAC.1